MRWQTQADRQTDREIPPLSPLASFKSPSLSLVSLHFNFPAAASLLVPDLESGGKAAATAAVRCPSHAARCGQPSPSSVLPARCPEHIMSCGCNFWPPPPHPFARVGAAAAAQRTNAINSSLWARSAGRSVPRPLMMMADPRSLARSPSRSPD